MGAERVGTWVAVVAMSWLGACAAPIVRAEPPVDRPPAEPARPGSPVGPPAASPRPPRISPAPEPAGTPGAVETEAPGPTPRPVRVPGTATPGPVTPPARPDPVPVTGDPTPRPTPPPTPIRYQPLGPQPADGDTGDTDSTQNTPRAADTTVQPSVSVVVPPDPQQTLRERVRAAFFEEGPAAAIVVIDRATLAEGRATEAAEVDALLREVIASETDIARLTALSERLGTASQWALPVAERRLAVACRGARHDQCLVASRQLSALASAQRRVAVRELNVNGQAVAFEAFEKVDTRVVGVLLPLSGPHAQLGQAAERAIRLAFDGYAGISLRVRDTAGDAAIAEQMARELIFVERVGAILGPIGRQEVARSAAVTRAWGIPHVVLASQLDPETALTPTTAPNPPDSAPANPAIGAPMAAPTPVDPSAPQPLPDDTAVRVRTSPEEVAVAVARQAMMGLALTRLAVLRPSTPAAERLAEAFKAEVVRLGGTITDDVAYDPEFKDFKPFAEALLAASNAAMPKTPRRRNPPPLNPLFQGLFIPDAAPRVRKILPFLEFAGVNFRRTPGAAGVQLFGVAGFNQPTIIDRGDGLTDNAIFADTWFESADDPRAADFGKRFFATHGQKAAPFHAEVFDAATVLADAVIGVLPGDHTVRSTILKRLVQAAPRAGVTGVIAFAANEATPRAKLLTVHGETIRERVSEDEERFLRAPAANEDRR